MAHLLACSVKMAHLWTDSCILCCTCVCIVRVCVCVYVCVWLSAKMAHLLACFVKMAHLWTDSHILCCVCVRACVIVRVFMFVCG